MIARLCCFSIVVAGLTHYVNGIFTQQDPNYFIKATTVRVNIFGHVPDP